MLERIDDLEEPASGTTSAALALYLTKLNKLSAGQTLVVERESRWATRATSKS